MHKYESCGIAQQLMPWLHRTPGHPVVILLLMKTDSEETPLIIKFRYFQRVIFNLHLARILPCGLCNYMYENLVQWQRVRLCNSDDNMSLRIITYLFWISIHNDDNAIENTILYVSTILLQPKYANIRDMNKMGDILLATFSNAYSWDKFHWS